MNEFTKEELEFLKWCVRQANAHNLPQQGSTYTDGFGSMCKKIQSVIDKMTFAEQKAAHEAEERESFRIFK